MFDGLVHVLAEAEQSGDEEEYRFVDIERSVFESSQNIKKQYCN